MERNRLSDEILLPLIGFSRERYQLPVKLPEIRFLSSDAHTGPFKHAVDIAVPNPEETETVVYSPASGTVKYLVVDNTEWGPTEESKDKLNFVHIATETGEFVEVAHIAQLDTPVLKIGERVEAGQPIARAAINGWMSETDGVPDAHVHMFVGKWVDISRRKFKGLRIRWQQRESFLS